MSESDSIQHASGDPVALANSAAPRVVVIGGGFSGAMTAAHLISGRRAPLAVSVVEPAEMLGGGPAYACGAPELLLNVPAGRMSAWPDRPDDFFAWLVRRGRASQPGEFVRRGWYGEYVAATLRSAVTTAAADVSLRHIRARAVDIVAPAAGNPGYVTLETGATLSADAVICATGNPPARLPAGLTNLGGKPRVVENPWDQNAIQSIDADAHILFVGTGLTMFDWIARLASRGHRGPLRALSRRGLRPHAHQPYSISEEEERAATAVRSAPPTCRARLRVLRRGVANAVAAGGDWRGVIDALRPYTAELWTGFDAREKQRFVQRLAAYWNTHRHRAPAVVVEAVQRAAARGQLQVLRGRIDKAEHVGESIEVKWRPANDTSRTLSVDWVVNCTGPESLWSPTVASPWYALLKRGDAAPDETGLGVRCTPDGNLIGRDGAPRPTLWTLGTPRRGELWESTAVPELRSQAAQVARAVLAYLPIPITR